ncbi:gamma-glutamyltransferase [Bacillus sp. 4A_MP2]
MLQILKILDHFNLSQYDPKSFEKYQLLAETMHLSYADRAAYAGDPEFVDVPLKGLLDDDYISERASLIQLDQMNRSPKKEILGHMRMKKSIPNCSSARR